MQCKDIPDRPVLKFVREAEQAGWLATWFDYEPRPANTVLHAMPDGVPAKLALAKMRQLIRRRLVYGCGCGCRGDFKITPDGLRFLAANKESEEQ